LLERKATVEQAFRNGRSSERPSAVIRLNPVKSGRDWRAFGRAR
jgi:hypothetical protein